MTENNIMFHYQMVRTVTPEGEEYTIHEAFSDENGILYMISPIPVYAVGDTREELIEMVSMQDQDIKKYGVVDYNDIQGKIAKYAHYNELSVLEPEYDDIEEYAEEQDFYDDDDKVLDLVEFMNKRK